MELECVFFSVTPTLNNRSRITLLLTSSSLARSLIRTFCCIPPCILRNVPCAYAFIASSRLHIVRGWAGVPARPLDAWVVRHRELISISARPAVLRPTDFRPRQRVARACALRQRRRLEHSRRHRRLPI